MGTAELRRLYVDEQLSVADIAARIGLSHTTTLTRLKDAGIPRRPAQRRYPPLRDRFMEKVEKTDTCWLWRGYVDYQGYGSIGIGQVVARVHRVSYEMFVGPIPDGLTIDHLCGNPSCVNPAHLEPVTLADNIRRGGNAAKTHCPRGHAYDDKNTRRYRGNRYCRACRCRRAA